MKPLDQPPLSIFVGSSSEAEEHYESICAVLEEQKHDVRGWRRAFDTGESFLAGLIRNSHTVDAALLIATPDDVLHYRGEAKRVLRDNVLFECGLFTGVLGPSATGIVVAGEAPVALPTDLSGISTLSFRAGQEHVFRRDARKWVEKIQVSRSVNSVKNSLVSQLEAIPIRALDATRELLLPRIENNLSRASQGIIELTAEQYFQLIRSEIESTSKGSKVIAVANSLSAIRWANDKVQNHYVEQNFLARDRGAEIRRLFLLEKNVIKATQSRSIQKHINHNIPVKCMLNDSLSVPMPDMVLFDSGSGGMRYQAKQSPTKDTVIGAQMIVDHHHCLDLARRFEEIWRVAWEPDASGGSIRIPGLQIAPPARYEFEPGREMTPLWTTVEVFSCEQAARVRGHELALELKSLVLRTSKGLCVAHVPGNKTVSLRKVKEALAVEEAFVADPEELFELKLGPGTVCAVLDPVWSMEHLVDQSVFANSEVFTNNRTRNGYFRFDPDILKSAKSVRVGDFIK